MNLLPKVEEEFSKPEYWNTFFEKRGLKEFEWYGEYPELCGDLHKYIKAKDKILVVGCGNSKLSSDLYDVGCRNITNIDISSVVIKQMQNSIGKSREEMIFMQMDVLGMTFRDDEFSVVLDKGTLDALMPKDGIEDVERARSMFAEVGRVLKIGGRYVIVSLLQQHILKVLVDFFIEAGWLMRIVRCHDVERRSLSETGHLTMPVFMVICTKFKKMANMDPVLELSLLMEGKIERVGSGGEIVKFVKALQDSHMTCYSLSHKPPEEEGQMELLQEGCAKPRYTLSVVDGTRDQRRLASYAAFIVPLGRETDWLFGTREGRRCLQQQSGYDRLAVVCLARDQVYSGMEAIKDELRGAVLQLAPRAMALTAQGAQVPYLTLGEGVGRRDTVFRAHSELSGDLVVEQVVVEGETFRRLVFLDNQAVIQSEVRMKPGKSKKGKGKRLEVDKSYVACSHLSYMSAATAVVGAGGAAVKVAVVGLGGGGLCMLTRQLFPASSVTGVEIDPLIVRVAEEWFGLTPDSRLSLVVQDGLEFVAASAASGAAYDVVMFDVDSKERSAAVSCPPPHFLQHGVLSSVKQMIGSNGVFVTNLVCRFDKSREEVISTMKIHFSLVCWYQLEQEVNQIVYCSNREGVTLSEWRGAVAGGARLVRDSAKQRLARSGSILDLAHLMQGLRTSGTSEAT